jgi:hypothetical protein
MSVIINARYVIFCLRHTEKYWAGATLETHTLDKLSVLYPSLPGSEDFSVFFRSAHYWILSSPQFHTPAYFDCWLHGKYFAIFVDKLTI